MEDATSVLVDLDGFRAVSCEEVPPYGRRVVAMRAQRTMPLVLSWKRMFMRQNIEPMLVRRVGVRRSSTYAAAAKSAAPGPDAGRNPPYAD